MAGLLLNVLLDYEQILKCRDAEKLELIESRKIRDQAEKTRQAEREVLQHEREVRHSEQSAQEEQRKLAKREGEARIAMILDAQK